jgi:hypothetical protein
LTKRGAAYNVRMENIAGASSGKRMTVFRRLENVKNLNSMGHGNAPFQKIGKIL